MPAITFDLDSYEHKKDDSTLHSDVLDMVSDDIMLKRGRATNPFNAGGCQHS